MRICFFAGHPYWGGIQNNGGSRTIIKSAQKLEKLGHQTCVVAPCDNLMYFKHDKPVKKIPRGWDFYIAVSIVDLHELQKHVPPEKTAVWIRGPETWRDDYDKLNHIVEKAEDRGVKIFVNSVGLRKMYGGTILYPGYDDLIWYQQHRAYDKPRIGVLYHIKHSKGHWFFKRVQALLGNGYKYIEAGHKIVGDEGMAEIYHRCDIWFAPTYCEGLHCPPMEAALCGCLVVCSDHPCNGMIPDYATSETAMIYKHKNAASAVNAIKNADYNKVNRMILRIKSNIGTRTKNMEKLVKLIGG